MNLDNQTIGLGLLVLALMIPMFFAQPKKPVKKD